MNMLRNKKSQITESGLASKIVEYLPWIILFGMLLVWVVYRLGKIVGG